MTRLLFVMLIYLALLAGVIWLQVFLSKSQSKWPGLILPIISFLFGLLYPLNMAAPSGGATASFVVEMIVIWLLGNIPTFVFLAIYFGSREKQKRNRQLDKMNIQDLD